MDSTDSVVVRIVRIPPIDRLLALAVIIIAHAGRKIELFFKDEEDAPEPDFEIGFQRYSDLGFGSDTERMAVLLADQIPETAKAGVAWLVQQANQNNKNGHLKQFPFSFSHFCREVWHLMLEDPAEAKRIMRMVADVGVLTAVRYCQDWFEGEGFERTALDILQSRRALFSLVENLKGKAKSLAVRHPLSLAGYLAVSVTNSGPAAAELERSLDLRPEFVSERLTEVEEFLGLFKRCEELRNSAGRELVDSSHEWSWHWTNERQGRRVCHVVTANQNAGSAIFALLDDPGLRSDIVVVECPGPSRRLFGRWSILTRKGAEVDLANLAGALQELEPGCWYLDTQQGKGEVPRLLNGSSTRLITETSGLEVSQITWEQLLGLIKELVPDRITRKSRSEDDEPAA